MKLPKGWPQKELPEDWPWPKPQFHARLIEAAQDPNNRQIVIGMEANLIDLFGRPDVGAHLQLPFNKCDYLRSMLRLIARHHGLRPMRKRPKIFKTKSWAPQFYKLSDIPEMSEEAVVDQEDEREEQIVRNKNKGTAIHDTSEKAQGKAPMVVDTSDKSKGKAPMVINTTEKSKGKASMVVDTSEKTKGREPLVDGTSEKSKGKAPMVVDNTEKATGKEPLVDGTSEKSKGKAPMVYGTSEKTKGKAPVIVGTSEKSQGKETMILNDYSADRVLDKKPAKLAFKSGGITNIGYRYKSFSDEFASGKALMGNTPGSSGLVETTSHAEDALEKEGLVEAGNSLKLGLGENRIETTSYKEEVSKVPGLVQVRDSLKLGLRLNRNGVLSSEQMVVDDYETSESEEDFLKIENEDNLMSRKRNRDHKWENEGEMLLYLKTHRWLQLDAICALYRHEKMIREQTTNRLNESNYQKITVLVEFLTNGSGHGPRARTLNELEEIYPGSTALSSWLVVTYANQLYRIYCNKSDLYFG